MLAWFRRYDAQRAKSKQISSLNKCIAYIGRVVAKYMILRNISKKRGGTLLNMLILIEATTAAGSRKDVEASIFSSAQFYQGMESRKKKLSIIGCIMGCIVRHVGLGNEVAHGLVDKLKAVSAGYPEVWSDPFPWMSGKVLSRDPF